MTRKPQSRLLTANLIHIGKWLAQTSTHSAYSNHHENRQNKLVKDVDKKIMKHGTNKCGKKKLWWGDMQYTGSSLLKIYYLHDITILELN